VKWKGYVKFIIPQQGLSKQKVLRGSMYYVMGAKRGINKRIFSQKGEGTEWVRLLKGGAEY